MTEHDHPDRDRPGFRRIPDLDGRTFLICIGAMKAATSWLFAQLQATKGVTVSPLKEVHFFDARFATVRNQAGLDPALSLHCLRHSYVTHLVEFGYPERFVQEQVGHAYASTTAIYASVSNDFKDKTLKAALARVYAPTDEEDQG